MQGIGPTASRCCPNARGCTGGGWSDPLTTQQWPHTSGCMPGAREETRCCSPGILGSGVTALEGSAQLQPTSSYGLVLAHMAALLSSDRQAALWLS